ncbi:DNA repair protein RecN [Parageobacillus thermoglucosidasius]|uniref:DNA repair protein RecN n=3 Tax=Anoxybacillaceae TaxID=3120669 RepID=Q6E1N9_PARTM|nr:DNA repair protein RecN [Parageobacillus thermoglucosidasius]AAT66704.1 DNA repair and genetic recombination protein [Geobacillus stearothermophilus]AAT66696.1 DNA repair and genetic recombination protein [Parageobacillus thermoglucosidasius]AAT66699.1 DNA repair and genetic recombination protein [Parageobacillus thermoglucosidasius]AAT66703.1 DNA repair and genetic recombination protein [Parageobacillus thermoglucosidasius]ALF11468.1 DNA repair protein RecN [Parageobacillus thermoglucosida
MLAELSIKNFAIIESLSVSFDKGLTVLTGETGAGKSIIIDAIQLLIGGRGSAEFVRYGEEKAEIEGLFLLDNENHPCYDKCAEVGIDISEGMVVLRREIFANGKSVCRVNGKLVTTAILRDIGSTLVDIHGQHEHQELMDPSRHLPLLDEYGGEEIAAALEEYRAVYEKYEQLRKKLKKLNENEQQMAHRLDLLTFQLDEIQKANLQVNEDEQLMEEKVKIMNFQKIYEALKHSYEALSGEHRGLDWIGLAMSHLEDVTSISPALKEAYETIANSYYLLEDITYKLSDELEQLEYDPARLDFIESRLSEINQLKRKYGATIEEILQYAEKIAEEIDELQHRETHIHELQKELKSVTEDLLIEAKNVTNVRQKYAKMLINHIHQELKDLYMEKTQFDIVFTKREGTLDAPLLDGVPVNFHEDGVDEVEFYISTNVGEPLKPLAKIASGGELSRIMLALKSIFSKHQGVTSIIFDEVDTGVSGRVAQAIAEKIYRVSIGSQVLCISHLPQVAAMADTHLFIAKETDGNRTRTSVKTLSDEEKVKEIGRMISGVEITELTKQHAKELLELAAKIKG